MGDAATASRMLERQFTRLQLPSERTPDVFDQEDFDAIKFINQIYPDESSLNDLDKFIGVLKKQIRAVDKEIYQAVRAQGGAHTRARQDLGTAHAQIAELFVKFKDIQRKAEESEAMVQEICRDIKKLDHAKRHLTASITALRRLAMLTAAINELEAVAGKRDQYRKCANLLEAVQQLMEYFQQYESIPKVRSLLRRLNLVQSSLQDNVLDDFKILMGTADVRLTPDNLDRLANACLVIDALGPRVRDTLMDWLCDREMTIYQAIFSGGAEGPRLDRFERRYLWFRQRLDEKKETWAIFPDSWRVAQTLSLTFCKITKATLKRILSDDEAQLREDIGPLIKTVVATNKFEREMAQLFGGGLVEAEEEEEVDNDNISASEARDRLEKYRRKAQLEAQRKNQEKAGDKVREAAEAAKKEFEGSISDATEGALRYYVAEEERELGTHLATCIQEEHDRKWIPGEDDGGSTTQVQVLQSANKLFFRIRASLTRCSRMISKGTPLQALAEVFQRILSQYAAELVRRLPKTVTGSTTAQPNWVNNEWQIRVGEEEEKVLCYILHTAEFCRETVEGLSAAIRKDIKPALADSIDFSEEEGAFMTVASQAMSVLVLGVNTRLDVALQEMLRVRWDAIEQPGDDSVFVNTVRKVLLDCAPRIGAGLDRVNFSFFCDKMGRMFVPRVHEAIFRLKRISEKGTLQLSIDADAIKRILLDFPKVARPLTDDSADLSSYTAYVEREMGSVIHLVKVLQSKPENLVDTYLLLLPAAAQTVAEFQRVCEIKALNRKQQTDLLAAFQAKVGGGGGASGHPAPSALPAAAPIRQLDLSTVQLNFRAIQNVAAMALPGNRSKPDSPASAGQQGKVTALQRVAAGAFGNTGQQRGPPSEPSFVAAKAKDIGANLGAKMQNMFGKLGGDQ